MFENDSKYRIWIWFSFAAGNIEGDFVYNFQTPCSSCKSKKKKGYLINFLFSFQSCNPRSSSGSPLSQYLYGAGGAAPGPPGPSHVNAAGGGSGPPSDPLVASPPPPPPAHVGKLRCTGKKGTNCCCFQSSFLFCCPLQVSDHHCIHYLTRNIHIQCWGLLINWLLGMLYDSYYIFFPFLPQYLFTFSYFYLNDWWERSRLCRGGHDVWKLNKIVAHFNISILVLFNNFWPIKVDLSDNKLNIFGIFIKLLSTHNCERSSQCWMRPFLWFSNTVILDVTQ